MIPYFTQQLHRKVVIYARVSTDHDAQLSALENQLDQIRQSVWDSQAENTRLERGLKKLYLNGGYIHAFAGVIL